MRKLKPDLSYTKLIDIDPDTPKLATTDANDGLTYNLTGVDKYTILWFYLKKIQIWINIYIEFQSCSYCRR